MSPDYNTQNSYGLSLVLTGVKGERERLTLRTRVINGASKFMGLMSALLFEWFCMSLIGGLVSKFFGLQKKC